MTIQMTRASPPQYQMRSTTSLLGTKIQNVINDHVVEKLDHTFLNKDIEFFQTCVPTAENIALYISDILNEPIKNIGANLHKIRLQESPNNAAEIYVEQHIPNSLEINIETSLVTQA